MSLTRKLVFAFLAVSLVGALLAVLLARWMTIQEFNRLVIQQAQSAFVDRAAAYYSENGSWRGVAIHFRKSTRPLYLTQPLTKNGKEPKQPTFAFALADLDGFIVLPGGSFRMREYLPEDILLQGEPVVVDGKTVGTVIASGKPPRLIPQEERYIERTNRALLLSTGGAALVAIILGLILARGLTRPLRELINATQNLAKGAFGQQVIVRAKDEIGELALAFNQMSIKLSQLTTQRQQMTADIAHDLRTPLTVISGYIESMQDGILEVTPDRLDTIQQEVIYLERLVDDLHTLSKAETGQLSFDPVRIHPYSLLEQVESAYRHTSTQKGVELILMKNEELPDILVDPDRMMQVLSNLVGNALRHTPGGGTITIKAEMNSKQGPEHQLQINITDTGEGISSQILPQVFDRFYRGDQAREDKSGQSGLGLAIANSIVTMHGGKLTANSEGLGKGSTFTIFLPIVD